MPQCPPSVTEPRGTAAAGGRWQQAAAAGPCDTAAGGPRGAAVGGPRGAATGGSWHRNRRTS
jgi:hypothetical protein